MRATRDQSAGKKTRLFVLIFLVLAARAVQAQYTIAVNAGAVTIVNYTGPGGNVAIPSIISNMPVIAIGVEAFYSLTNVTGVTIPSGVTNIEEDAFYNCSGLTNITMANSITNIGENAFNLCSSLPTVAIPSSVISVGEDAFSQCSSLASVTIPNGVTSIGIGAFSDCSGLSTVTIPSSVTNIGLEAFLGCSSVTAFTVITGNMFYSATNGVLFNKNQTILIAFPCAIGGSYAVPAGVTNIETYAFFGSSGLANVTIPGSVTNIGDFAFYDCASLSGVFFQGDAPSADSTVFSGDAATVYYLPGANGWDSPFADVPALEWNPLIQSSGVSFGVRNNQFGFNVTGTTNIPIRRGNMRQF